MSAVVQQYAEGKDHLKMSGSEYYSLVAWLKARGHGDLEDHLLKVRTLGDKKFHLVRHIRDKCASVAPAAAMPAADEFPADISDLPIDAPLPPAPAPAAPPPVQMGGAQVLTLSASMGSAEALQHTLPAALVNAVAAIQQAAPIAGGPNAAVCDGIRTLEGTLGRLEESLNFAVECMQSDLAHAKQQLAGLKAQVGM